MDAAAPKIACRDLWKLFGPGAEAFLARRRAPPAPEEIAAAGFVPAVIDASLAVRPGEIFVIMGLSGSGKSTLVRCLSRLVEPSAGEVRFEGRDLRRVSDRELIEIRRHRMGMVFQNFALLPHLSVLRNVAFPLEVQGVGRAEREAPGARDDRARRAQGARGQPAARALGRAAAAGGDRPVAGGRAGGLVPRRAVLGARSADPPRDAERVPAAAGGACTRPSSSSPTTSTRRSGSPTGSRSCATGGSCRRARRRS